MSLVGPKPLGWPRRNRLLAHRASGRPFASTALKQSVCGIGHSFAQRGPFEQGVEHRAQRLSPLRQTVLHLRRNLVMNDPADDYVDCRLAKLLDEHLLGNGGNRST